MRAGLSLAAALLLLVAANWLWREGAISLTPFEAATQFDYLVIQDGDARLLLNSAEMECVTDGGLGAGDSRFRCQSTLNNQPLDVIFVVDSVGQPSCAVTLGERSIHCDPNRIAQHHGRNWITVYDRFPNSSTSNVRQTFVLLPPIWQRLAAASVTVLGSILLLVGLSLLNRSADRAAVSHLTQ